MATTQQMKTKHARFPRKLGRFLNLEGGLYGSLDLVALTADQLELQTGEDFVRFDREQATNLRDAIDKFLALDKAADDAGGESAEAAEVLVEQVVTRAKRPRRRRLA
jgi:hypothetical protein